VKTTSLLVTCLALAGAAWAAAEPPAPASATQKVLARIEARMAEVRTVRARFRQVKRVPLFAKEIVLHGEIGLEKPDRFLWRVEQPVPYCLVMDKSGFRQWDAETGRVQRGRLEGNPVLRVVVDQLTGFFSGRFLAMTHEFEIGVVHDNPVEISGVPKPGSPAGASIRSFDVRFGADERYVAGVTVVESQGGETQLEFHDVRPNTPLPPELWEVEPRGR
jgi:outer membrane lipoprotein-sorting protein